MGRFDPPFHYSGEMVTLVSEISEAVGAIAALEREARDNGPAQDDSLKTICAALAFGSDAPALDQVAGILEGKQTDCAPKTVREVMGLRDAYGELQNLYPYRIKDMLEAHRLLMDGLSDTCGRFRTGPAQVLCGEAPSICSAPPAVFVEEEITGLLEWAREDKTHALIKSGVFYYAFGAIRPFADGNGRLGRMWLRRLLTEWRPVFARLPIEAKILEHRDEHDHVLSKAYKNFCADPVILFLLRIIRDALTEFVESVETALGTGRSQTGRLLAAMGDDALSGSELMQRLGLKSRAAFRKYHLLPALEAGTIEMTLPDKPNSRNQKYRRSRRTKPAQ